jgi:hypothetical protein
MMGPCLSDHGSKRGPVWAHDGPSMGPVWNVAISGLQYRLTWAQGTVPDYGSKMGPKVSQYGPIVGPCLGPYWERVGSI